MRSSGSGPRRDRRVLAVVMVTGALGAASLGAQEGPGPAIVGLESWAGGVWLSLLDRDGAWYGRLAEEGIFQRFNPRMDDEYALDLRSGLFEPGRDARWAEVERGLRVAGVSISHPHILNVVDWRERIPITDEVALLARYHRERSLTARRDYPWIGVEWRDVLGSGWDLWSGLGIHFVKPSSDVELGVSRSWRTRGFERWRVEVRVAALDAFSDVIFQGLGVGDEEVDAHLDYRGPPLAARVQVRGTWAGTSFELQAGGSPRSEVEVSFPGSGDPPFRQLERVGFVGGRVQVRPRQRVTLAVFATLARADIERRISSAGGSGFGLREQTERLGARAESGLQGAWVVAVDVEWLWRPEERSALGDGVPSADGARVRHHDREAFVRLAVLRRPSRAGWTARVAYELLDRKAGVLAPALTTTDHRLTTEGGHRFASSFEILTGVSWDLDALGDALFDGAHVRLSVRWQEALLDFPPTLA